MRTSSVLAVVIAIAACGPSPTPSATPLSGRPEPQAALSGTPVDAPIVTLLDAGTGRRQKLRYEPEPGTRGRLAMRMNMQMAIAMNGRAIPLAMPPMTVTADTMITGTTATTFDLVATITATDVEAGSAAGPDMEERLRVALAKMIGMSTTTRMDRRGVLLAAGIDIPPGVDAATTQILDSLKQSMTQATAPLPEEPVGLGARWSVASVITNNTMTLNQTAVFTLTELHDRRGLVTMQIAQHAPRQEVKAAGGPAGATSTLDSLTSDGTGSMRFDLVAVMPTALELATTSEVAMTTIPAGALPEDAVRTTMRMSLEMTMAAVPVAP